MQASARKIKTVLIDKKVVTLFAVY